MKTVTFLLLMMISCLGGLGQKLTPKKRSNVEEIRFQTKAKDSCTMTVTGDEEVKLRIECRNQGKSYWSSLEANYFRANFLLLKKRYLQ
ncbi:fibroblast growth factor-binding protein 2 [Alligator mississippiensis]|uniref:Fibroblast growth factor-binding protein 2 n=1 Tax=Alligator mississippiensis TaxID=8496 RepID=A0A151P9L6_ALLMI|nr:fibroblast growth factor-binding protein 2 [Alligator mississippiensis]